MRFKTKQKATFFVLLILTSILSLLSVAFPYESVSANHGEPHHVFRAAWDDRGHITIVEGRITVWDSLPDSVKGNIFGDDTDEQKAQELNAVNQAITSQVVGQKLEDRDIGDDDIDLRVANGDCEDINIDQISDGSTGVISFGLNLPAIGCRNFPSDTSAFGGVELHSGRANDDDRCPTVSSPGTDVSCFEVWFEWISQTQIKRVDNYEDDVYEFDEEFPELCIFHSTVQGNEHNVQGLCPDDDNPISGVYDRPGKSAVDVYVKGANDRDGEPVDTSSLGGDDDADAPNCENQSGTVFGWILCPILEVFQAVYEWIYESVFEPLLNFSFYDDPEAQSSMQEVWGGFRFIANLIFILAFLVIMYSAATGNVLSAYDVRKLLPRLFIAGILVQLSYVIAEAALRISNDIGDGVRSIILFPVNGLTNIEVSGFVPGGNLDGPAGFLFDGADVIGSAALGVIVLVVLLILFLYSILGMLILLLVFLFRNVAIVLLIAISPIAFALSVLPGTESYFRLWWKWYFGMLSVYAIMMAFISSGILAAAIVSAAFDGFVATVLASVVLVLPYFVAPSILRFAGQAAGALQGAFQMINDNKDKLRNTEGYQRYKARAGSGNLMKVNKNSGKLSKGFRRTVNTGARGVHNPWSFQPGAAGRRRTSRMEDQYAKFAEEDASGVEARALNKKLADMDMGDRKQFLRDRVQKGSKAARTAAFDRMILNNDFEGAREAFKTMTGNGEELLVEDLKSKHAQTLLTKAPHLVKTDFGQSENLEAIEALTPEQIGSMHTKGIEDVLNQAAHNRTESAAEVRTLEAIPAARRTDQQNARLEEQRNLYAHSENQINHVFGQFSAGMNNPATRDRMSSGTEKLLKDLKNNDIEVKKNADGSDVHEGQSELVNLVNSSDGLKELVNWADKGQASNNEDWRNQGGYL